MNGIFYIVLVILVLLFFYFGSNTNEGLTDKNNTKVVLYQDYRSQDPSYIYDSPGKIDVALNTNLKSAYIDSGNNTVEIWRIWDSPNSNSASINSDFYSYIVPYAMRSNSAKYQLVAKVPPNSNQKINFSEQINKIRLIIW